MSIYICTKCGRVYDEMPTVQQLHPYGNGFAYETVTDDMCRCGGDIVEAEQCSRCGGYFEPYEMYGDLCISCDFEVEKEGLSEWED